MDDYSNNQVYQDLRDKWTEKHRFSQEKLWHKHGDVINDFVNNTKNFVIGSVSGLMLLTSPLSINLLPPSSSLIVKEVNLPVDPNSVDPNISEENKNVFLVSDLSNFIPNEVRPLTGDEESSISAVLTRDFGFKVVPELSGIRLNRSYGLIGAEQHLALYPGDNMVSHLENSNEKFHSSGMAPGLGAWGYFAATRAELKDVDILREKYYIAAQTFLAPGFSEHTGEYISFFKFRKMLVVNPHNGRAMVAVIGDAGPGEQTGKHLGGSPEVMNYLERVDGEKKGPVLYFFIDDPEDKIPLGPVETKSVSSLE